MLTQLCPSWHRALHLLLTQKVRSICPNNERVIFPTGTFLETVITLQMKQPVQTFWNIRNPPSRRTALSLDALRNDTCFPIRRAYAWTPSYMASQLFRRQSRFCGRSIFFHGFQLFHRRLLPRLMVWSSHGFVHRHWILNGHLCETDKMRRCPPHSCWSFQCLYWSSSLFSGAFIPRVFFFRHLRMWVPHLFFPCLTWQIGRKWLQF